MENDLLTLRQAAEYAHVTRQAIYLALRNRGLTALKANGRWYIKRGDIDEYRKSKYDRSKRRIEGELVHDLDKGNFSVMHLAKIFSLPISEGGLGRPYTTQRIYYLLRIGEIKALRKGATWIIPKEEVVRLYEREKGMERGQRMFL